MELQLNGKRAVVSGSTAGIGYAIAAALAREGAAVVVKGRTPPLIGGGKRCFVVLSTFCAAPLKIPCGLVGRSCSGFASLAAEVTVD